MRQPWWSVAAALGLGLGALMGCDQNKQVDMTPDPVAARPPPTVDTNELVGNMPIGAELAGTAEPARGSEEEEAEAESNQTSSSSSSPSSSEPTSASDESPSPGTPTSTTTTTGAEVPMSPSSSSARDAGKSSGEDNVIIPY